jgi:hypothetical protein
MIEAHAVPIPSDSVLAPLYVGADLLDAFAIHLPAGASDDTEVLARVAFERQAAWIRALTWVRDTVMATVGVKSSRAIGAAAATRGLQVIGYLPLLSKSAGELVMGGDDRHLDFRVAVLLHLARLPSPGSLRDQPSPRVRREAGVRDSYRPDLTSGAGRGSHACRC